MQSVAFSDLKEQYAALWQSMKIDPANKGLFDSVARRLYASMARYKAIERVTGVPATMIMVAHERESGGDFDTYLGNGEPLSRVTTMEPKGRGPFGSFTDGAIDALNLQGLSKIKDWTLERLLFELERYNGFGYRLYHSVNSPYLWARTSNYTRGKYISDGKWDGTIEDRQTGCAGIIASLWAIDPALRLPVDGQAVTPPPVLNPTPPVVWPQPDDPGTTPTRPRAGFFTRLWALLTKGE